MLLRPFLSPSPPAAGLYTLSLHDALPILLDHAHRQAQRVIERAHPLRVAFGEVVVDGDDVDAKRDAQRSEEHTSELQSPYDLVCRLLLEKKKKDVEVGADASLLCAEARAR